MILTIDIPNAVAAEVVDDICNSTSYAGVGTKAAWARAWLLRVIKQQAVAGNAKPLITTMKTTLDGSGITVT